jgi:hypothetical protein
MNKNLFLLLLIICSLPLSAQGDSLVLPISLSGLTGELTVTFESVTGLTTQTLGASSQLVPPLDPSLLSRLPSGVSIPLGFPVLTRIEPPPAGGLEFHGPVSIQTLASVLSLSPNTRVYSAPIGGPFQDITTSIAKSGLTYRAVGSSGGFSEFLLVVDSRPVNTVIGAKLDRLDGILAAQASTMPSAVAADLASRLATVRSHIAPGSESAALQDLDDFIGTVTAQSGTDIPDLWRAARDRVDVAGQLRAAAATLQFSLRVRQGSN